MRSKLYAGCWLGAIMMMFCVAGTASSQTVPPVSFQAARTFAGGVLPQSVAVADFNGDGKPDLAVADNNGAVSVLLGNGDGTFQAPVNYPVGINLISIAVGDFNGDGKPDLVLADYGGATGAGVWVLLGNGDGTFGPAVNYAAGTNPISVAVGDFNHDGKADLVVVNLIAYGTVSVLLGNGDGTFQAAMSYPAGLSPRFVAVGDFNGDGNADLAVADSNGGGVSVLLNNGDGTFSTTPAFYAAGSSPYSVAVGDFNHDGKSDLAVANADGSVSVLFGNGNGTFQPAVNYATGGDPISVAVGDFNGDGMPDLVVANNSVSSVSVLLNNGDGTFTTVTNSVVGSGYSSVALGDFNGDGKPDLAVTDSAGWNVSVLLGNGNGTFQAAADYAAGTNPISVAVGDFNHDGKADLAVADFGGPTGSVWVLSGNGDGTFQTAVSYAAGSGPASVALGDFNGDGKPDLVVANYNDGNVSVLLAVGDGTFYPALNHLLNPGITSVAVGDFNGDGKLDVAAVDPSCVYVLLGNGDGTLQAPVCYGAISNSASVAVGDFNGDGKPDLAVTVNGGVSVLLNDGNGAFPTAVFYPFGIHPKSVAAVGDFNGDGILDLAVTDVGGTVTPDSGGVWVLLGKGDGTFQPAVYYVAGGYPVSVAVGDFNGDGKLDLAVANQFAGHNLDGANINVLLGNGDGTFQAPVNYAAGRSPVSVAVGDFNGDGKPDLAVANTGGKLSVLLNTTSAKLASSIALMSSLNPSTFRQSVTFTATVSSSGGGPTGIVTFNDGVTALGTGPLSTSGQATFTTVGLTTGPHSITAVYGGDSKFLSSTSPPLAQTVNQATTATTVTSSLNPSTFGQSVTFTATASSSVGIPTGMVTFFDGVTTLGTGALTTSGQATLATAALPGGTHTITAGYGGDTNFATSASSALTQTVKVSTTTTVTSSPNPSTFGQSVIFTATVSSSGGVPTGLVTFLDGATTPPTMLGTGALNAPGQATFSTSALAVGSHSITASYSGDALRNPSTSSVLTVTVNKASTSTSVTSSQNPQLVSQPITFAATVASQFGGIATGSVIFKSGTTTLGTVALSGNQVNQASLTTSFATAGTRSITAQYVGDTNNTGSTSTALSQSVVKKFTTTSMLASSLNPSYIGQAVTLTAAISSTGGTPPDGEVITFKQGGSVLATSPLSGGKASFTTSTLTVGKHTITASYAADATFSASSASLAQVVQKYPTSTSLTSSLNPSIYGQPVTLSATVSSAGSPPTGTVTFKKGTTNLASPVTLSSGLATLTLTNLVPGTLSITATYNGDGSSAVSTSAPPLTQIVNMASTSTTVVSSLNPSTLGQLVTFTATVSSATVTPAGTVTFSSGATVLGTKSLAGGKASLATTTLPQGTNTITATYNGTANITGSTASLTQTVQ